MFRLNSVLFIVFIGVGSCGKIEPKKVNQSVTQEPISIKDKLMIGRWLELDRSSPYDTLRLKYSPFPEDDTAFVKYNTFVYVFVGDSTIAINSVFKHAVCGGGIQHRKGSWSFSGDTLIMKVHSTSLMGYYYEYKCAYRIVPGPYPDLDLVHLKTYFKKEGQDKFLTSFETK